MSMTAQTILCGDCAAPLKDAIPSDDPTQRKPCASCGSTKCSYHVFIVDSESLRDGLGMKANRPGEKRPHIETKAGPDHSRSRRKLVHREQIFDRENDRYFKRVTDYESDEIIHECEEPLSQHVGHGADKKNKKDGG